MWHGNPMYDARQFNATPGINHTQDFLFIINCGRSMATVAHANQPPIPADEEDQELYDEAGSVGEQNNIDMGFDPSTVGDEGANLNPDLHTGDPRAIYEELEEEEPEWLGDQDRDMEAAQDLDRDQAMIDAALGTWDNEHIPQQPAMSTHCSL